MADSVQFKLSAYVSPVHHSTESVFMQCLLSFCHLHLVTEDEEVNKHVLHQKPQPSVLRAMRAAAATIIILALVHRNHPYRSNKYYLKSQRL